MSKEVFSITRFGNPVLREVAVKLTLEQIRSVSIRKLIDTMSQKLASDEYGVGLAAPQVGRSVSLSVIGIKPTPTRPDLERFNSVIINPSYRGIGDLKEKWEGCISCGSGDDTLYAKVPRYESVRAQWVDEAGVFHDDILKGFVAHVFQHEADHLDGILFVDLVRDTKSYMTADEYRKRIVKTNNNS